MTRLVVREVALFDAKHLHFEDCPKLRVAMQRAKAVAETPAAILIEAETGTGKGVLAKLVHEMDSVRCGKPFIAVNCGAIPETLFESEMFGYVRGAFTDAKTAKKGKFVMADGGTLFLDEVGVLSERSQVKLLSALDTLRVTPIGGTTKEEVEVDVRVIAATNEDLARAVERGEFRADLYYRLDCVRLRIPPLRERSEAHFIGLVHTLIAKYQMRFRRYLQLPTQSEIRDLRQRSQWPGNVRQLEQCVARAVALHSGVGRLLIEPPDTTIGADPESDRPLAVFDDVASRILRWAQGRVAATGAPVCLADLPKLIEWRLLAHASAELGGPPPHDHDRDRVWEGIDELFTVSGQKHWNNQRWKTARDSGIAILNSLSVTTEKLSRVSASADRGSGNADGQRGKRGGGTSKT